MKRKIILNSDDYAVYDYSLYPTEEPFGYEITINTDLSESFDNLISNTGDLNESIDGSIDITDEEDTIKFLEKCKDKKLQLELLKNAEYVYFEFDVEQVGKYIKKNPSLKDKKIIFYGELDLNSTLLDDISNNFEDTSNLYFRLSGNATLISFQEYQDTFKALQTKIEEINKYDFSPLEKIMYVYDMTRDKLYVEVDENEDKLISRNLSSALLGNKIVCVGYAVIFKTLLNMLDIDCKMVYLMQPDKLSGHARNVIYIKDEKYGIDGVYYFDPTWDNKKVENDNSFLSSYRFFGMTKTSMNNLDNGNLVDQNFPYFSDDIMWKVEDILEEQGFSGLTEEMLKSINHMGSLVIKKSVINKTLINNPNVPDFVKPKKEDVVKTLYELADYFYRPLLAETLLKVLYNVRKVQYYANPEKYPFGLNEFFRTVLYSKWEFESTPDERFITSVQGLDRKQIAKMKLDKTVKYAEDTDLYKNIQQVKLAKILRRVYEQKKN